MQDGSTPARLGAAERLRGHISAILAGVGKGAYGYAYAVLVYVGGALALALALKLGLGAARDAGALGQAGELLEPLLLQPFPVFAAVTAAPGLVLVTAWEGLLKPGAFHKILELVISTGIDRAGLDKPIPEALLAHRAAAVASYLRAMMLTFLAIYSVVLIAYFSAFSWGLAHLLGPEALFEAGGGDALSPFAHALFWLSGLADLLALEAPSLFGYSLSPLAPRGDGYAFLTLILLYKLIIVIELARYLGFILGVTPDPEALTPGRLPSRLEDYAREHWVAEREEAAP